MVCVISTPNPPSSPGSSLGLEATEARVGRLWAYAQGQGSSGQNDKHAEEILTDSTLSGAAGPEIIRHSAISEELMPPPGLTPGCPASPQGTPPPTSTLWWAPPGTRGELAHQQTPWVWSPAAENKWVCIAAVPCGEGGKTWGWEQQAAAALWGECGETMSSCHSQYSRPDEKHIGDEGKGGVEHTDIERANQSRTKREGSMSQKEARMGSNPASTRASPLSSLGSLSLSHRTAASYRLSSSTKGAPIPAGPYGNEEG